MSKYSTGFRNSILRKVLPPESRPIAQVCREEGISNQTIRNWVAKAKDGTLDAAAGELSPDRRSISEKMSLLLESRSISKNEIGNWLRKNGLHSEHLSLWEQELRQSMTEKEKTIQEQNRQLKLKTKKLEKELARKDKALAEMAALLTLKKKVDALLGGDEDD
ncbi:MULTISPECIES: transposase [unclassified Oceanispirochaeta]|uniref:transposase n=1 Tax=unclassified Oceanispirochaeta TaxID=2635722 RepID=UPI000E08E4C0|nr:MULTISPECIES: transposase [unclassified Oceanispirochaeta]MBF9019042.1 transposase [Oceanispirochaeta sp. M2]NPD75543.1 transposase [Oceanispirochaeta sp. M1]RDG28597.1 helix-turn-helix domain-containing protein [Oceanispirochaeta sp. M1]